MRLHSLFRCVHCISISRCVCRSVRRSVGPSRLAKSSHLASIEASSIISNQMFIILNCIIVIISIVIVIIIVTTTTTILSIIIILTSAISFLSIKISCIN